MQHAPTEPSTAPRFSNGRVKYIRSLDQLDQLSSEERMRFQSVAHKYLFRANDYYLSLIDWDDPSDPIRRLVIPDQDELKEWGQLHARWT